MIMLIIKEDKKMEPFGNNNHQTYKAMSGI